MSTEIREPVHPVPVFLPPSMFDFAKAQGIDITDYRKTRPIPTKKERHAHTSH